MSFFPTNEVNRALSVKHGFHIYLNIVLNLVSTKVHDILTVQLWTPLDAITDMVVVSDGTSVLVAAGMTALHLWSLRLWSHTTLSSHCLKSSLKMWIRITIDVHVLSHWGAVLCSEQTGSNMRKPVDENMHGLKQRKRDHTSFQKWTHMKRVNMFLNVLKCLLVYFVAC